MGLDPVTWALIGAATAAVASATTGGIVAYQQYQQANEAQDYAAKAAENEAAYQQEMMDYNAKVAEQQAKDVEAEAAEVEKRKRAENERFLGMQRALYGKSGALLSAGTPLAVLGDTAANLEMEALDVRRQGQVRAMDLRSQGRMYSYQGQVAGSQGGYYKKDYTGSLLGGIGSAVGSLAQAGSSLYQAAPPSSQAASGGSGQPNQSSMYFKPKYMNYA